jgi:hypothetical protein
MFGIFRSVFVTTGLGAAVRVRRTPLSGTDQFEEGLPVLVVRQLVADLFDLSAGDDLRE